MQFGTKIGVFPGSCRVGAGLKPAGNERSRHGIPVFRPYLQAGIQPAPTLLPSILLLSRADCEGRRGIGSRDPFSPREEVAEGRMRAKDIGRIEAMATTSTPRMNAGDRVGEWLSPSSASSRHLLPGGERGNAFGTAVATWPPCDCAPDNADFAANIEPNTIGTRKRQPPPIAQHGGRGAHPAWKPSFTRASQATEQST